MRYKILNPSLFLKYAYPCIEFWYKNKKLAMKIKGEEAKSFYKTANLALLKELKSIAEEKKKFRKNLQKKIEKLVPFAISFILKLGKKSEKGIVMDENIIRNYFCNFHRNLIKKQKKELHGYKDILELCDVKIARIIKIKGKEARVKILRNGERKVKLDFIKNPKVGDRVRIHFFYACEKL